MHWSEDDLLAGAENSRMGKREHSSYFELGSLGCWCQMSERVNREWSRKENKYSVKYRSSWCQGSEVTDYSAAKVCWTASLDTSLVDTLVSGSREVSLINWLVSLVPPESWSIKPDWIELFMRTCLSLCMWFSISHKPTCSRWLLYFCKM